MGKSWLSVVKKALIPQPKQKKEQKKEEKPPHKVKKWFGKSKKKLDLTNNSSEAAVSVVVKDQKLKDIEEQQSRHAHSVAIATAAAAEAAVKAAQAAAEVVRLTASISRYPGKSEEDIAAIKIQTAFRGYMARRALRALRGLVRLKSLVRGKGVKRQATSSLQSMQTRSRLQYQIRERRLRRSEDKQARARQLQQIHNKEFVKNGEDWNDSTLSREKVEANMLNKQEATMRRERALAYAYSHQNTWKNKLGSQTFMDSKNPNWGWSWLERSMSARPNENRSVTFTPESLDKNSSVKSVASRAMSEMVPRGKHFSPKGKTPPLHSRRASSPGIRKGDDQDSKSALSIQSEQVCNRRHSICGSISSTRDDESFTTTSIRSKTVPSYMAPTQAAKARARFSNLSPLGLEKTAKKRLFFPASPRAIRRLSGPPKLESNGDNKDGDIVVVGA